MIRRIIFCVCYLVATALFIISIPVAWLWWIITGKNFLSNVSSIDTWLTNKIL